MSLNERRFHRKLLELCYIYQHSSTRCNWYASDYCHNHAQANRRSVPTPAKLLCTDDQDLILLQLQLIHAVAYSLSAKQAPEWVVDAVDEFSYHLKSGQYRTVSSFNIFFQNEFKAGSETGEESSGGGSSMIGDNGTTLSVSKSTTESNNKPVSNEMGDGPTGEKTATNP
jgi:hypothetical protein